MERNMELENQKMLIEVELSQKDLLRFFENKTKTQEKIDKIIQLEKVEDANQMLNEILDVQGEVFKKNLELSLKMYALRKAIEQYIATSDFNALTDEEMVSTLQDDIVDDILQEMIDSMVKDLVELLAVLSSL